jgi:ParB/RepB/Spo0J family partition protein
MAGLVEIPVIVRDVDDRTALEIAIVENVQRADLNPLEEAQGYEQLIAQYGYTQNDLGEVIGKSRSHVANSLRLLKLPDEVRPCCPKAPCRPVMPGPSFPHPIRSAWPKIAGWRAFGS